MQTLQDLQAAYSSIEQEAQLWCRIAGKAIDHLDAIAAWEVEQKDDDATGDMVTYADKAASDIRAAYAMQYRGPIRSAFVMPAPETPIQLHSGQVMPAMFFFALEHHDLDEIATEQGFELAFRETIGSLATDEANDALAAAYVVDPDKVLAEWDQPAPQGWQFGGKWHGEECPVACFLRKKEITP